MHNWRKSWFLLDEEDKCMSNSEWNSWVASHSLVQIECGPSGVNFKQLDRATSVRCCRNGR
jgi:hypothetical protein